MRKETRAPCRNRRTCAGVRTLWILLLGSGLLATGRLWAQEDSLHERNIGCTLVGDGRTFLHAVLFVGTAPARWNGSDLGILGAGLAGTAGSALLDNEVNSFMLRNQSTAGDNLQKIVVHFGEGSTILLAFGVAYTAALLTGADGLRETALLAGTATALASGITSLEKIIVGRARPYLGRGNHLFLPFSLENDFHSFPSGHTTASFALMTVLAMRVDNPLASVGFYTLAGLCGISRLYTSDHWLSDVVFGAFQSTLIAQSLVRWYEGEETRESSYGLRLEPAGGGIRLVYRF
jgi:membrane-associated phospholipid phosphatase